MRFLFEPRSVAVIGASHNEKKIGYIILKNIVEGGYQGRVYPVNPQGGELLGMKVYTGLDAINGDIDVAAIAIPAPYVFEAVKICADRGVKFAVIITAGFSEAGRKKEEEEIVGYANARGMRILGPNVLGYYSAGVSLNMTFALPKVSSGEVAIISQSGGLGIALVGKAAEKSLRLSAFFSIGNKADIKEAELLEYLAEDERTKVIMIYMEGVKNGEKLMSALKKNTAKKPVIIVKSGSSSKGAQAVASHTGALAGSDEIFSALMKQSGALRAESLSEALDWCSFFVKTPFPAGNSTVIITNGGGLGVMAVDALEKRDVTIYDDHDDLKKTFSNLISEFGSYRNPVDMTGNHDHNTYATTIKAAIENKNIQALMVIYCHVAFCDLDKLCEVIADRFSDCRKAGKAFVFVPFGNGEIDNAMDYLSQRDVPVFDDLLSGVSCIDALFRHSGSRAAGEQEKQFLLTQAGTKERINGIVRRAVREERDFLLAGETRELLEAAGIDQPEGCVVTDEKKAVQCAEKIGYPAVMKVVSPDILHKSDAGGVIVNLEGPDEVREGFDRIRKSCMRYNPDARFRGVEVSRMLEPGMEVIVGARRDASFGPVIMCGLGGIYVEVLKDVAFRAFPSGREEVRRMLKELKAYPLMTGIRGKRAVDVEAVIDALLKVGEILLMCPEIQDIEINPVFVYLEGAKAVDARVIISPGG